MTMLLNLETRPYHADVDGPWHELMTPSVTRLQYLGQLQRTFGFISALEAALAYTPGMSDVLDMRDRNRSGFIAQDLLRLGLGPSHVANVTQCPIAPFADHLEALGWLYMIERSTLLYEDVADHILLHLPEAKNACAFLLANSGKIDALWADLAHALDQSATDARAEDRIVCGAHDGFRRAVDWFRGGTQRMQRVG